FERLPDGRIAVEGEADAAAAKVFHLGRELGVGDLVGRHVAPQLDGDALPFSSLHARYVLVATAGFRRMLFRWRAASGANAAMDAGRDSIKRWNGDRVNAGKGMLTTLNQS